MTSQELISKLISNIAVLTLVAEILSRFPPIQEAISNERRRWEQIIMLSLIFGGIIILSTAIGINIGSYRLDTKAIGALAAGLLGGPVVGFLSSSIGALYVLFFFVPKTFAKVLRFLLFCVVCWELDFIPIFREEDGNTEIFCASLLWRSC